MTLTEFLLARIAEDEAEACKLLRYAQENEIACKDPNLLGRHIPGWHEWPEVQTLASKALAECEAKRRIVEEVYPPVSMEFGGAYRGEPSELLLSLLALPYAHHPDHDESWRP